MTDHVDVVVTHYNDPRLSWVLNALDAQTYSRDHMHVVVADDGSDPLPQVSAGVGLVTQNDEGFRAAAARNLGAREGSAPFIVFLDGDTVPEPDYVARIVAAMAGADDGLGVLAVGRRRHADLAAVEDIATWLQSSEKSHVLPEPTWLSDGYARTRNLREAGSDDWRFVISAVMGMTREAFERLEGFDVTLVGYGGEDWELAYRAWNTGIALVHEPAAIAWHDGVDAGGRAELSSMKQGEQLALAQRIPQPLVRGNHLVWLVPRIMIHWSVGHLEPRAAYVVLESWMALGDVALYADKPLAVQDPRVKQGVSDTRHRDAAEFVVTLDGAVVLRDAESFLAECSDVPRETSGCYAARTRHLRQKVPAQPFTADVVEALPSEQDVDLESWGRARWS